jgi:hypothetical protein
MGKYLFIRAAGFSILLLVCCVAGAQVEKKDSLTASFTRYQLLSPQEKLFVHIDKAFYLAGEMIWFKVYDIDGASGKPMSISAIAYVEILDKDERPVMQAKIPMKDGKGDGAFRVPPSLPSGPYLFRAYTSWMKNFSPDFYFRQQLTIINTLSDTIFADTSRPSGYDIQFFPEGGNLVNGLSSIVAFKAVSSSGEGAPCEGIITNQHRDTITRFQTSRFGMGKFIFTPVKGNTYFARISVGQSLLTKQLPAAFDQGYTMHLEVIDERHLRVTVHSTILSTNPILYLFVHTRNQVKNVQASYLTNNEVNFSLNKDSLGDGISQITLFDSERMPLCERLYFKRPLQKLHIGVAAANNPVLPAAISKPSPTIPDTSAAAPAPPEFATRSKIAVTLSTTDQSGLPLSADLSMSVFLIDSLQSVPADDIISYLLLSSDLKGRVESPQYYFQNTGPEATEALNNLMLTQGWTRFRWEDVLQNKKPYFEFLPEMDGPLIYGKITDKRTGLPPPPTIGYLSLPGKNFKLATAQSRADGSICFHLDDFYGARSMIVQPDNSTDSNCRIDISVPFSDRFSYPAAADSLPAKKWASRLLYRSINAQAENAYHPGDAYQHGAPPSGGLHPLRSPEEDTSTLYGTADRVFYLDDYVRFVTIDEVIREYVDNVHIRRQSGKAYFRVRNALFNTFFDDNPLLLIDGVPVFSGDKMIEIDPLRIEKIEIVSRRYYLGPVIGDGLVSFRSYDGDLGGYRLDPNSVAIQYNGLDQRREFYSPVYDTKTSAGSRLPDFRNQLLWSPDVTTDTAGNKLLTLFTSDMTGRFALVVQGMTKEGLPGYSLFEFTVAK